MSIDNYNRDEFCREVVTRCLRMMNQPALFYKDVLIE